MVGASEEKWTNVLDGDELVPNHLTKFTVEKLVTGKKYRFRLAAINKAGSSEPAEFGPVVCAAVVGRWQYCIILRIKSNWKLAACMVSAFDFRAGFI